MATMKPIQIGLLGAGTVARGVVQVLTRNQEEICGRAGRGIEIAAVAGGVPNAIALMMVSLCAASTPSMSKVGSASA